jgi:hypothetical protein
MMRKKLLGGFFKIIVVILLSVIAVSLMLLVLKNYGLTSNRLNGLFILKTKPVVSTPTPTNTTIPTPTPKPEYSVTFLTHPDVSNMYEKPVFVDVKIKNFSVTPFITGLRVESCDFIDATNTNRRSATGLVTGGDFQKAIKPGEERVLSHQQLFLDAGGMSGLNAKGQLCNYDASGNYGCSMVKGLKIVSCEISISGVQDFSTKTVSF